MQTAWSTFVGTRSKRPGVYVPSGRKTPARDAIRPLLDGTHTVNEIAEIAFVSVTYVRNVAAQEGLPFKRGVPGHNFRWSDSNSVMARAIALAKKGLDAKVIAIRLGCSERTAYRAIRKVMQSK